MFRADAFRVIQIGHRTRDLQDPVVRTSRQTHFADRQFERPLSRIVQRAQLARLLHGNIRVVKSGRLLNCPSLINAPGHFIRARPAVFAAEFLYGTAGTLMCKSIRSNNGSLIFPR